MKYHHSILATWGPSSPGRLIKAAGSLMESCAVVAEEAEIESSVSGTGLRALAPQPEKIKAKIIDAVRSSHGQRRFEIALYDLPQLITVTFYTRKPEPTGRTLRSGTGPSTRWASNSVIVLALRGPHAFWFSPNLAGPARDSGARTARISPISGCATPVLYCGGPV